MIHEPINSPGAVRGRGITLLEILIAIGVAGLLLSVMAVIYAMTGHSFLAQSAQMEMQERLLVPAKLIRLDLLLTDLQTIRSYPNDDTEDSKREPPGLSMESPCAIGSLTADLGPLGVVHWQKYVYYSLRKDASQPGSYVLWRAEGPLTDTPPALAVDGEQRLLPVPSTVLPSRASTDGRIVARGLSGLRAYFGSGHALSGSGIGDPVCVDLAMRVGPGRNGDLKLQIQVQPRN